MRYDIKTAAGARTRLVFRLFPEPEKTEVELHVRTDAGVQSFSPSAAEPASVLLPPLCAGRYLYDFCLSGQVLLHGELQVRPSALWGGCAEVLSVVTVDLPLVAFVLNPGPRGEIGAQGPQGLSAYELAAQHGYDGSEADWVAELQGAQAAAAEAKLQAQQSAQAATSASGYAAAAGTASTAAAAAAELAGVQANTATGAASTAKEYRTLSQADAEAAATSAGAAAGSAKEADDFAGAAADSAAAATDSAEYAATSASAARQSATTARQDAAEAQSSAFAAANSATAAADTLAAAPKLNGINSFSETNTFNGMLAANGGITGLPAPTGWSNPPNLHDGLLSAFAGAVTSRRIPCQNTLLSAGGTLSDTGLLSSPANVCAVVKGAINPMFSFGSYSNLSSLWLPVQMSNVDGSRCRLLLLLQDRLTEPHYKLRQTENIDETFYYYAQETLTPTQHFAVAEILISISNSKQTVDLWSYEGVETGQTLTTVKKTSCTLPSSLSTNFVGIIGFLFVRTSADEMKVFAVTFSGYLRITLVGSVFTRGGWLLFLSSSQRALYTAVQGGAGGAGRCMVADALELQLNWSPGFYYPGAVSILQADTPQLSTTLYSIGADGSLSELTQ